MTIRIPKWVLVGLAMLIVAAVAFMVGRGGGGSTTTIITTTEQAPDAVMMDFLSRGFSEPSEFSFSVNGDLVADDLAWTNWGEPTATADGKLAFRDYPSTDRVQLLGTVTVSGLSECEGQSYYTQVSFDYEGPAPFNSHQGQINGSDEEFFDKYGSKLDPEERHDPAAISLPPYYPDTPMVRKIWARYYDLMTFMDKQVGDVLDQLQTDGLADNTIVFFFSDHGLGLPRFKRTLYDSGLHVPLMIRLPAPYQHLSVERAGVQVDELVSFVDFAPTVLSLAGLSIPNYMQGRPFLGRRAKWSRKYIFGASSRVDEAYEFSRCVRDDRYKYIRNFMPHLPYIQPSEYPDQAEIMQELRRVAAEDPLTPAQGLLWAPDKPVEELYDTLEDPHEINNLANSPQHRQILAKMRDVLYRWMFQMRDLGLLPEAEMHIRAEGSTPYDIARDPGKFPRKNILAAADLVGRGPESMPAVIRLLSDPDSAVRYWAVIALTVLGSEARTAVDDLKPLLEDSSPNVRFAAAGALCKLWHCEEALEVLAGGLEDEREETVLYAARELQSLGEKACPVVSQMEEARARCKGPDGEYKNNNHATFIDWALKNALENCPKSSDKSE